MIKLSPSSSKMLRQCFDSYSCRICWYILYQIFGVAQLKTHKENIVLSTASWSYISRGWFYLETKSKRPNWFIRDSGWSLVLAIANVQCNSLRRFVKCSTVSMLDLQTKHTLDFKNFQIKFTKVFYGFYGIRFLTILLTNIGLTQWLKNGIKD